MELFECGPPVKMDWALIAFPELKVPLDSFTYPDSKRSIKIWVGCLWGHSVVPATDSYSGVGNSGSSNGRLVEDVILQSPIPPGCEVTSLTTQRLFHSQVLLSVFLCSSISTKKRRCTSDV